VVGFLAVVGALLAVSTASAHNAIEGRWAARLPGGAVSYYQFLPGTVHPDDTIQGRFHHVYLDDRGVERTVHGTYVLLTTIGNRGRLTLFFDDGQRVKDVEHGGGSVLQLRHVGLNRIVTYYRQP